MAPIELPQESSHPSHWTIDLCSTSLSVSSAPTKNAPSIAGRRLMVPAGKFSRRRWRSGCASGRGATDVPTVLGAGVRRVRRRRRKECLQE
jgi:hypothetical protein